MNKVGALYRSGALCILRPPATTTTATRKTFRAHRHVVHTGTQTRPQFVEYLPVVYVDDDL